MRNPCARLRPWSRPETWTFVALVLLLAVNAAWTPNFTTIEIRDGRLYGPVIDIVYRAAPTSLLALGMALVIATGGIDLSVGAVMAIAAAVSATMLAGGGGAAISLCAALSAGLAVGAWNGVLVAVVRIQPIVATLVLMVAGRGLGQLVTRGQIVTFHNPGFEALAAGAIAGLPLPVWIVAGALGTLLFLTRATPVGIGIEAVGAGERAARISGIPVTAVRWFAYAVCGVCAAMAGAIAAADIRAADANNIGLWLELDAILAVVLGGGALTGGRIHLVGAVLGATILQTLTTMILMLGVGVEFTLVVKAIIVILLCILQSPRTHRALGRWFERARPRRARGADAPAAGS